MPIAKSGAAADVFVDGALTTRVRASTWRHIGTSEDDVRIVRGFDFHLPEEFADGNVHRLILTNETGETIGTKELAFIAYPDGLRKTVVGRGISEQDQLRAQLFDQQVPMSLPFSEYQGWREKFSTPSARPLDLQCAVVLVGPGALEASLDSLNEQTHAEWIAASLPQTSEATGLHAELVSAFLDDDGADCEFIVFALAGTLFAPSALERLATAFSDFPDARAAYTDLEIASDDGSVWPIALPAFDYERMLEQGYCAHFFALRRAAAEQALQSGASNLYRLFNSMFDDGATTAAEIVHLPGPLGTLPRFNKTSAAPALAKAVIDHLQHVDIPADATVRAGGIFPAVHITRAIEPASITIVIPTRNRHHLLQNCIELIRPAVDRAQVEVLIVDNDSSDSDTLDYLADIESVGATILRVPGEFNFPRLNNLAAEAANGEFLCLLNNDIKALDDSWLDEMMSRIRQQDVGAVGALLLWPSKVIQHGGVVLGSNFSATHAFNDRIDGDSGYCDMLRVAHECSAVTAACMVTRKSDYLEVGGMDEVQFPINYNDVDYCLKLRALGKRIIFTPHAKLIHIEFSEPRDGSKPGYEGTLRERAAKFAGEMGKCPRCRSLLQSDTVARPGPIFCFGLAGPGIGAAH